ncbi:type II secretion system F family protein [Catellatospora citrea]|uniref:type II secretion system F family protein n=1 Tax=Catellatospora citrea TaxID=53366 RepID=UPI0033CC66F4
MRAAEPLVVLWAITLSTGLMLLAGALRRRAPTANPGPRLLEQLRRRLPQLGLSLTTLLLAVGCGLVAAAVTGWPVAGLLTAIGAVTLPRVLGPDRQHATTVARIEAVAAWAEDLAGTMRAARGVEQAITQTATAAPTVLAVPLQTLAADLRHGTALPVALRTFADDVADPTADLVVAVLLFTADHGARDVAASLSAVAAVARRQAAARARIAASRARNKTAARLVTAVVITVTAGSALLAGDFLAPYRTPTGQAALAALGVGYGACLAWLHRLARTPDLPRILVGGPR